MVSVCWTVFGCFVQEPPILRVHFLETLRIVHELELKQTWETSIPVFFVVQIVENDTSGAKFSWIGRIHQAFRTETCKNDSFCAPALSYQFRTIWVRSLVLLCKVDECRVWILTLYLKQHYFRHTKINSKSYRHHNNFNYDLGYRSRFKSTERCWNSNALSRNKCLVLGTSTNRDTLHLYLWIDILSLCTYSFKRVNGCYKNYFSLLQLRTRCVQHKHFSRITIPEQWKRRIAISFSEIIQNDFFW